MTDDLKTPEQMAEEYADCFAGERRKTIAKKSFFAGYEARKNEENFLKRPAGWISVEERLPEENIKVLVLFRKRITAAALTRVEEPFYEAGYFRVWTAYPLTSTDPYEQYPWNEVTYWMPLPELPKGEE